MKLKPESLDHFLVKTRRAIWGSTEGLPKTGLGIYGGCQNIYAQARTLERQVEGRSSDLCAVL